ncbi:histidine phosphatase family protein [Oceanobacillus sp. CAU 1775]
MKKIYLVRHCEAEGQPPEAKLTENGREQALKLSEFLSKYKVDRIISSPYKRAVDSIHPFAQKRDLEIEINKKLSERILSSENLLDWQDNLRSTFKDLELKFEGGESSQEAMTRIVDVVNDAFSRKTQNTVIVTHGNIMSLLLKHFDDDFGFDEWKKLGNPDVFLLEKEINNVTTQRIWK